MMIIKLIGDDHEMLRANAAAQDLLASLISPRTVPSEEAATPL